MWKFREEQTQFAESSVLNFSLLTLYFSDISILANGDLINHQISGTALGVKRLSPVHTFYQYPKLRTEIVTSVSSLGPSLCERAREEDLMKEVSRLSCLCAGSCQVSDSVTGVAALLLAKNSSNF